jgi:hypothetical protein
MAEQPVNLSTRESFLFWGPTRQRQRSDDPAWSETLACADYASETRRQLPNSRDCRAYSCKLDMVHRDPTAWLGM